MAAYKSILLALTDAMVTAINNPANGWVTPITPARRAYAPVADLSTLTLNAPPLILLLPLADPSKRQGSYHSFEGTDSVELLIYARVASPGTVRDTRCDLLMTLRQQLHDIFKPGKLAVPLTSGAELLEIDSPAAYGENSLLVDSCFCSAQTLIFRVLV